MQLDQSEPHSSEHGLRSVWLAQLVQDALRVAANGFRADIELMGNLPVRIGRGHPLEHLKLTGSQRGRGGNSRWSVHAAKDLFQHIRMQVGFPMPYRMDGTYQ